MPITIDTESYKRGLLNALHDMGEAVVDDQRKRANRIANDMKAHAPRDPQAPDLPQSIGVTEGRDGRGRPYFDVGTSDDDAFYQEFGTRYERGHPFARAAVAKESR